MSKIQWTEKTWNPVKGCSIVSPGCTNCYAMKMAHRIVQMGGKGGEKYRDTVKVVNGKPVWTGEIKFDYDALEEPFSWRAPRIVFVNSMSDIFYENLLGHYIDLVFSVMAVTPHITYQILTKRSAEMRDYIVDPRTPDHIARAAQTSIRNLRNNHPCASSVHWKMAKFNPHEIIPARWPLPNVWLGVSVEDQDCADERIPDLIGTPAAVRFVSFEPLLGPVNVSHLNMQAIDWAIIGGESGPGSRPFVISWTRSLIKQLRACGTKVFIKQLGARPYSRGLPLKIKDRKGGDPSEWPEDLRIREMPEVGL